MIFCGLAVALACVLVWPEGALGGTPPSNIDPCDVIDENCARVRINIEGSGSGTITSSPEGLSCTVKAGAKSGDCENWFLFTESQLVVQITQTAAAGSAWGKPPGAPTNVAPLTLVDGSNVFVVGEFFELPSTSGGTETTLGANTVGVTAASEAATAANSKADAAVTARLITAKSSKNKLGKRRVQLKLHLDENVSAKLKLIRGKKTLAGKQFNFVTAGNRVLTLLVPAKVAGGKATLVFTLRDAKGNALSGRRGVTVLST